MANFIVGIDFGAYAIRLVEVDTSSDPVVVTQDEERLPPAHRGYLEPRNEEEAAAGSAEETEHDEDEGAPEDQPASEATPADREGSPADAGASEVDASAPWIDSLTTLLDRHEFSADTTFLTFLPQGRAISIHVDVPFDDHEKVDDILPNLLEDRLPMAPSEIVYDFRIIGGEDDEEHQAVVGLGRRDDIGTFLDRLQEASFDPAVLGIPELMLRYVAGAAVPSDETAAVLDVGHRTTRVAVLEEGAAVMARSLDTAGADVTRAIAREFDLSDEQAERYKKNRATAVDPDRIADPEEAAVAQAVRTALRPLVRELRRNFQSLYATSGVELDQIYVCGGTSRVDHFAAYFENQLGVPVGHLDLRASLPWNVDGEPGQPESALALSMALQPIRDASNTYLHNLRTDEFAYQGGPGILGENAGRWLALAAGVLVLFFGSLLTERYRLQAEAHALEKSLASQSQELFGREVTEPSLIQQLASGKTGSERAFVPEMSAYQLYFELMSRISEDIELQVNRIDVDTDRNIVQMAGVTTGPQTVDRLISDLEKLECLENVEQRGEVRVKSKDEARFQLEIQSKCS